MGNIIIRGVFSGLVLYVLIVICDKLLGTNMERLLLNIDFITGQPHTHFFLELIPHLLVSIVLYIIFSKIYLRKSIYFFGIVISIIMFVILYFQLSHLSVFTQFQRSVVSFTVWMGTHCVYLIIVHIMLRQERLRHANISGEL